MIGGIIFIAFKTICNAKWFNIKLKLMNNFFRTIIAGYGAKKLGGGCLSTILIFVIIYYALGHC